MTFWFSFNARHSCGVCGVQLVDPERYGGTFAMDMPSRVECTCCTAWALSIAFARGAISLDCLIGKIRTLAPLPTAHEHCPCWSAPLGDTRPAGITHLGSAHAAQGEH